MPRLGQRLASGHLDKWVFGGLIRPLCQKISDLAVIQTVEQPSAAKSLSIILILKLAPKPWMKWMRDAKPPFNLSTVRCSLLLL